MSELAARRLGRLNLLGMRTLWGREVRRGLKIWPATIGAHAFQALLFAAVFSIVLAGGRPDFIVFLLPGLVGATILQRAFEASAFSIVFDKMEGVIRDIVGAPLSPAETLAAYTGASVTSAFIAGATVWITLQLFGLGLPDHPILFLYFAVGGSVMISTFALLAGIWADKWDHLAAVQTFLFMPIVFLSGVFFSLDQLPETGRWLAQFNPLYYVIDGVRHGLTGGGSADPAIGVILVLAADTLLWSACYFVLKRGYKLKS